MCCCGKPTVNGELGYRWNNPNGAPSVRPVNPPQLTESDRLLYDEPGRCGGLDSHCHHYCVVSSRGSLWLLVRHGGGDERFRLSVSGTLIEPLAALDSNGRYWMLNAIYHAQSDAARKASNEEMMRWRTAAYQKRIRVRKQRGGNMVKVWIEPVVALAELAGEI